MSGSRDALAELVRRHRGGEPTGLVSVCSAHPLVLDALMHEASAHSGALLIEATSNQVDQHGGYTGMRPADFRELVHDAARRGGIARERVILGGDHLGPNRWRTLPATEAMAQADELVDAYVTAGFTKLHLDCSMSCADDPAALGDGPVSQRAARLIAVAERAAPDPGRLSYVVGTEVPVPGGAAESIGALRPTSAAAARATLRAHRDALAAAGLSSSWRQVRGLVVQPGVEFDQWSIVDYDSSRTTELQQVLDAEPGLVFEAHSTDHQTPKRLAELVRDHWAILKVGPGLTFALREALFALEAIETELCPATRRSHLRETLERRMLAQPGHWRGHHPGDDAAQRLARVYSYSDRMRYYWPDPETQAAVDRLLGNLTERRLPLPLLSQHLPLEHARVRGGELAPDARSLVIDHIGAVLRGYQAAVQSPISACSSSAATSPSTGCSSIAGE